MNLHCARSRNGVRCPRLCSTRGRRATLRARRSLRAVAALNSSSRCTSDRLNRREIASAVPRATIIPVRAGMRMDRGEMVRAFYRFRFERTAGIRLATTVISILRADFQGMPMRMMRREENVIIASTVGLRRNAAAALLVLLFFFFFFAGIFKHGCAQAQWRSRKCAGTEV